MGAFEYVALDPAGKILALDVLEYRETHGSEIRLPAWRKQFLGHTPDAPPQFGSDVVAETPGTERTLDITNDYVARLLADWDGGDRLLKVVWDNGNGAAGDVLEKLVASLPGEHIVLNGPIDGTFPAHHPDPTVRKNAVRRSVWSFAVRRVPGGLLANLEVGFEPGGALHLVPHLAREATDLEAAELESVLTQAVDDLYARAG